MSPEAGAATSLDAVSDLYDRYRLPYREAMITYESHLYIARRARLVG